MTARWVAPAYLALFAALAACASPDAPLGPPRNFVDSTTHRIPATNSPAAQLPQSSIADSMTRVLGGDTVVMAEAGVRSAFVLGPMAVTLRALSRDTSSSILRALAPGFAACPFVLRLHRMADRSDAPVWQSSAAGAALACPVVAVRLSGADVTSEWSVPDMLGDSLPPGRYFFSYTVRLADGRTLEYAARSGWLTADSTPPTRDLSALRMFARSEIAGAGPRMLVNTVTLVNSGAHPVRYDHGACTPDLRLYRTADRTGPPVWRSEYRRAPGSQHGYACPAILHSRILAPGDTAIFRTEVPLYEVIADSLPAARYFVAAELELLNDDLPVSQSSKTYVLSAGDVVITREPDPLPNQRTRGPLTYTAATRIVPGLAGADTVRTTVQITNTGATVAVAEIARDCAVTAYGYRSAAARDLVPIQTPVLAPTRTCYLVRYRFALAPGQSWTFGQDMLAADLVAQAGAGRYHFTAWLTGDATVILAAGDVTVGR